MSNDLISREALALDVRRNLMPNVDADGTVSVEDAERYFLSRIAKAPAVDAVEVVHAKWEQCFEDWRQQIEGDKCSACGFEHYGTSIGHYNYCPNCGARMDGE